MTASAGGRLSITADEWRQIVDSAVETAIITTDLDGIVQSWSEGARRILGWTEAEMLGQTLARLFPDDSGIEAIRAEMREAIELGHGGGLEAWRVHKDGSRLWATGEMAPIRDADGQVVGFTKILRDRSNDRLAEESVLAERRQNEARLKQLNDELEERVEAEIARRAAAEEALRQSQKMEAVGQLTGGIAHDFNNLLTVVTGNVGRAQRAMEAAGFHDPRTERSLENALKGAERAAALTQRLLAFSRRQPLAPKAIDLDRLVTGMSDLLQRALGETVKLEIVANPGLWRTEADPNQLESAILNLALNGRDAMPEGGELVIESANVQLDEGYAARESEVPPGQYVMVAVTDTGTGMKPDVIEHAFEPFFTTKEVGKGTGLGLSMVYGFVKQSGGHVKIYSEEGHGSTIKIYLPRLIGEHSATEVRAEHRGAVEGSPRHELVLVVEDDADVRAYTIESLQELGYRVLEAEDGPSALREIRQHDGPIDLLFTDVVMPGMSGRELAEEARLIQPSLRVLYTSGYTRNAIVHGGRLDPGVEMIMKPFTFEALAAKVRDMIDNVIGSVLLAEADPDLRAHFAESLADRDIYVELAATAAEALGKVRAAQGRYGAVVLDDSLTDRPVDIMYRKIRSLYADLPVVLASADRGPELARTFAGDRCVSVIDKPYTAASLHRVLQRLGVRCRGDDD